MSKKSGQATTKPLTEAELAYFRALNDEAQIAYQRHLEMQRRLTMCLAFLREQHAAPEEEGWGLKDLSIGFVRIKPLPEKDG